MLVACRLAGLSALETYYARVRACARAGAGVVAPARLLWRPQDSGNGRDVGRADPKTPGLKF